MLINLFSNDIFHLALFPLFGVHPLIWTEVAENYLALRRPNAKDTFPHAHRENKQLVRCPGLRNQDEHPVGKHTGLKSKDL